MFTPPLARQSWLKYLWFNIINRNAINGLLIDAKEWCNVLFLDESRFILQHYACRICVLRHPEERMFPAYILHRHPGPSSWLKVWDATGYMSRSPLACITFSLNSGLYISAMLRSVALAFIRTIRNSTFLLRNSRKACCQYCSDLP